jgi:MinD-like ATPase involved in chromosome partitioning or flagellar assembly
VTQIITFYSFKGGVGRTMSLVNTAFSLARQGARVLMVDFDLEAPGMTHFFGREVRRRRKDGASDALDLLLAAKRSLYEENSGPSPIAAPLALSSYTIRLSLRHTTSNDLSPYLAGRVDLLPATLEPLARREDSDSSLSRDYLDRIAALDLPGIFGPGGPGHLFGQHVGDYLRNARFEVPGDPIFALRNPVQGAYDFVLVDSRTGLNEIAGLCVGPLCDSLVVCTALNEQNLAGTSYFLERTGLLDKVKGKPYILVVGPVPPWRSKESAARIATIQKVLAANVIVEVPYHPAAALGEHIFVLESPSEAISRSFDSLGVSVMRAHLSALQPLILEDRSSASRDRAASLTGTTEGWTNVAAIPSACRLAAAVSFSVSFQQPTSPTPLLSMLLAQISSEHTDGDLIARAVAVALCRRAPATVAKEVTILLDRVPAKEVDRERILIGIAFFFSRLHGRRGQTVLSKHLKKEDQLLIAEVILGRGGRTSLAGLALRHISGTTWNQKEFDKFRHQVPPWFLPLRFGPSTLLMNTILWKVNYLNEKIAEDDGIRMYVSEVTRSLPILGEKWPETEIKLRGYPSDPPGFSLILATASLIATVDGPTAIHVILKCIHIGRRIYGYAWRVMINWNRLAPVRDCPEFKEFLSAEDAAIEHVERQFDEGVWPL